MLELNPLKALKWVDHEHTETRFEIRPLSAADHDELRRLSHDKKGNFNVIVFSEKVAKKIINDWEGVGDIKRDANNKAEYDAKGEPVLVPQECHDLAKLQFGRRFAYSVMPWLIEQARDFDEEIEKEKAEGKNA